IVEVLAVVHGNDAREARDVEGREVVPSGEAERLQRRTLGHADRRAVRQTLAEELVVERADLDVALFVAEREVEREILVLFLARARLHAQRVEDPVARIREIDRRPDFGYAAAYGDVDVARVGSKHVS